jgi:regulator of replication initiation timing
MEALKVLEDRINVLLEKVNELTVENKRLVLHNEELQKRCEEFSTSLEADSVRVNELDKEKELTKTVIDDLIKSIDSLV